MFPVRDKTGLANLVTSCQRRLNTGNYFHNLFFHAWDSKRVNSLLESSLWKTIVIGALCSPPSFPVLPASLNTTIPCQRSRP